MKIKKVTSVILILLSSLANAGDLKLSCKISFTEILFGEASKGSLTIILDIVDNGNGSFEFEIDHPTLYEKIKNKTKNLASKVSDKSDENRWNFNILTPSKNTGAKYEALILDRNTGNLHWISKNYSNYPSRVIMEKDIIGQCIKIDPIKKLF